MCEQRCEREEREASCAEQRCEREERAASCVSKGVREKRERHRV